MTDTTDTTEPATPPTDGDTGSDTDPGNDTASEAAKWKALARKHEAQAKANAAAAKRLAELEEADKTEAQKAADRAAAAEQRAAAAEASALRLEVALEKAPDGMSLAQIRKLAPRLAGASREELEVDADELFADFAPSDGSDTPPPSRRRPREALTPGASPNGTALNDDDPLLESLKAKLNIQ